MRYVQQRSFFPWDNREHLTTMQPAASKPSTASPSCCSKHPPAFPESTASPRHTLLTCLTATVHIRLNHASILKQKAQGLEEQQHKQIQKKQKECIDLSQTWIHSVSLKGGQTTPEARTTAPTAVSIQSNRVQLATHELPACKPHEKKKTLSGKCIWGYFLKTMMELCVFLTYSSNIFMDKFAENAPRKSDKTSSKGKMFTNTENNVRKFPSRVRLGLH